MRAETDVLSDFEVSGLVAQIADHIKQAIVSGNIKQGEKLPSETEMAERLNVSRNTVRGALTILSDEELIETKSGRGGGHYAAIVTEQAIKQNFGDSLNLSLSIGGITLEEVIEMRRIIEVKASYMAALRRTDEDLKRLRDILDFLNNEPLSNLLFCNNNYIFNKYISMATKNRLIILNFRAISQTITPLFKYIEVPLSLRATLNEELKDIYNAIYNKDPQKASMIMNNHLNHFESFFSKIK